MPNVFEAAVIQALFSATQAKIGIIIRTSDVRRTKAMVYRIRQELADPELANLQIRASPTNPETDLWFIRMKEPQVDI